MFIGILASAGFTQTAPLFELPAPTGKSPVGTTRWVVTDPSRQETFATGQPRQVEVIAWYPAVASAAATAPYLRDGMEEVLSFARLAKLGERLRWPRGRQDARGARRHAGRHARRASR